VWLELSPLSGELLYGPWVLDPANYTLTAAILPFSVVNERDSYRARVYLGERLLEGVNGRVGPTLITPSKERAL
jgi:hypothetical protein